MKKCIWKMMVMTGFFVAVSQASAIDLTTGDSGSGDANLNENLPDDGNNNTTMAFRSRLVAGSYRHSAVALRFNLAGLSETVTNAVLKLDVTTADADDSFSIDVFGVVDGTVKGSYDDFNWPETAVTYNTMPGISGDDYPEIDRDLVAEQTVLLGSISYIAGTVGEIQMASTQALLDFINADTNGAVTFILEPEVATVSGDDNFVTIRANRDGLADAGAFHPTLSLDTIPIEFSGNEVSVNANTDGQSATLQEHAPDITPDASNLVDVRRRNIDGSERNNVGAFQFDIPSMPTGVMTAGFSVSLYQASVSSTEILVYGLNENAAKGGQTEANWDQASITYNTMPGLNDADGDCQTSELIASNVTYLGSFPVPGGSAIGDEFLFSSEELADFINTDSNQSITLLLEARSVPSGRDEDVQFISAQRGSSGSGTYPTLILDPAPPSTVVITMGQVLEAGLPVSWDSYNGLEYRLESKTNLLDVVWTTNQTGIAGTGGNITVTATVEQASAFYRIVGE